MTERRTLRPTRRSSRRVAATALVAALGAGLLPMLATPVAARAAQAVETYALPTSGTFTLSGLGYGHGIGMSQFGAEGMGQLGKGYRDILSFYYPGTDLRALARPRAMRVALSGMTDSRSGQTEVTLVPRRGLSVRADGGTVTLPKTVGGAGVTGYRVVHNGNGVSVWADAGSATKRLAAAVSSDVVWSTSDRIRRSHVTLLTPGGSVRTYHGRLALLPTTSGFLVVDELLLEHYLRAVVSLEVPGSWTAAALQAQAVAARSYALLVRKNARAAGQRYDICDTTSCQVFGSMATESSTETAAVSATAGEYLASGGQPAFTQFSSANGGYSVAGSQPYLVAQPDPYDGVVTGTANWGHAWTRSLTAAALESAWPTVGSVQSLKVLARDGNGDWGGRVLSVGVVGSAGAVTVSGDAFRIALGLKSTWWVVTNAGTATAARTPAPKAVRATAHDRSFQVTWQHPDTKRTVSGYVVRVKPGGITRQLRPNRRQVQVRGLVNGVTYRASVAAVYGQRAGSRGRTGPVVPTSTQSYFRSVATRTLLVERGVRSLRDGGAATVQVSGVGTVPDTGVRAAVLRVSAGAVQRGSAVAWRGGSAPHLSAVTFGRGQRVTGLVTVPVSAKGTVTVGTTVAARVLRVDLVGYYTQSGVASWSFHSTGSAALADSTAGVGLPQARLRAGSTTWVKAAGRAGVPSTGATAVLVNVTLLRSRSSAQLSLASPADGFISGLAVRTVAGARRTASAVAALDSRGRLALRLSGGAAHVRVDVLGWFGPHDGTAAGRYTFARSLLLDARADGPMAAGEVAAVPATGVGGVPASARSVVLLVRAYGAESAGSVSLRANDSTAPARTAVTFDAHGPTRNLVTVPVGKDGSIEVACSGDAADVDVLVVGWYS